MSVKAMATLWTPAYNTALSTVHCTVHCPGWVESLNGPTGILGATGKGVLRTMWCRWQLDRKRSRARVTIGGQCVILLNSTGVRFSISFLCSILTLSIENLNKSWDKTVLKCGFRLKKKIVILLKIYIEKKVFLQGNFK